MSVFESFPSPARNSFSLVGQLRRSHVDCSGGFRTLSGNQKFIVWHPDRTLFCVLRESNAEGQKGYDVLVPEGIRWVETQEIHEYSVEVLA